MDMESLMDKHLMDIQQAAKVALVRFEESGVKIDKQFVNYFQKLSVNRFTQTCERYLVEAKFKIHPKTSIATTTSTSVPGGDWTEPVQENVAQKRKSGEHDMDDRSKRQTLEPSANNIENDDVAIQQQVLLESMLFFCAYCRGRRNLSLSVSGTIDSVYEHWLRIHAIELIPMPFQFYAVELLSCFYCDEIAVYDDLVRHHEKNHSDKFFTITNRANRNECGICHFKGTEMIAHFKKKHDLISAPNIFNPVYYLEEIISKLLLIHVKKMQNQCSRCYRVFKTANEITEHQCIHATPKLSCDNQNTPIHLICGYCKEKIDCAQLLSHFRDHNYNFCCSQCQYRSPDIVNLVSHEKIIHNIDSLNYHCSIFPVWVKSKFFNTNMVFANGLVLKMFNVQGTKFDDSRLFDMFVEGYLEVKKERANQMIELKTAKMHSNDTPNHHETNSRGTEQTPTYHANTTATFTSSISNPIPNEGSKLSANPKLPSNRYSDSDSVTPIDEILSHIELQKQNKLEKNVIIIGIPRNITDEQLLPMIMNLFNKLGKPVSRSDVKDVVRESQGVVVRFHRKDVKLEVIRRLSGRRIWSNELTKRTEKRPSKITIQNHLTPYYLELWKTALECKKKNDLYTCKISNQGLIVKRKESSVEEIILKREQLMSYICANQ